MIFLLIGLGILGVLCLGLMAWNMRLRHQTQDSMMRLLQENQIAQTEKLHQGQIENLQVLQKTFYSHLQEARGQLNQQYNEGMQKNSAIFTDIVTRLTVIDEAQKKITELSSSVVSLQEILSNKSSRGAFGEVQLSALIQNMLPSAHYALQHTLSNGKRADCILFLPHPTGNIVIDAKFPLENYQRLMNCTELEKAKLRQLFIQDIKKHIQDIRAKYIIPQETASGAIMFIPAESVFASIHDSYPELVQYSQESNVWLVSPTTLMAVLTTARAVLKDDDTRKHVHVIQEHLKKLSKDFERFEKRMQNLKRYIQQANDEAGDVNISAQKIIQHFSRIEQLELTQEDV